MSEKITAISPVVKQQLSKMAVVVNALEIKCPEDLATATDIRGKIKKVGKLITEEKKKITDPLRKALDAARAFFVPFEQQADEAEQTVKMKMLAYERKVEQKRIIAEVKIEARVEAGTLTPETAAKKLDAIVPEIKTVEGATAKATFKVIPKYEVVDKSKLPKEFLQPDTGAIWNAVRSGVKEIPGCRIWEEKTLS